MRPVRRLARRRQTVCAKARPRGFRQRDCFALQRALGVSISMIDRRVVPSIDTVKLPWGQRLTAVDELERFLVRSVRPTSVQVGLGSTQASAPTSPNEPRR